MMSEMADSFDRHTLGLLKTLEKREEICDVQLSQNKPCDKSALLVWEQKNACMLPEDLKGFYLTMDGLTLSWNVKLHETLVPVGRMTINSVSKLNKVSLDLGSSREDKTLEECLDLDGDDNVKLYNGNICRPTFDSQCRRFELDPCDGFSKVCLVYCNTKSGVIAESDCSSIWLLDRSLRWHQLADSFMSYYRMMLVHLGLPQWQYAFTDTGVSPQAKQWFNIYCPARLTIDAVPAVGTRNNVGQVDDISRSSTKTNELDVGKVFKGRTDKRKPTTATSQQQSKKKTTTVPFKPGSGKSMSAAVSSTQSVHRTGSGQK